MHMDLEEAWAVWWIGSLHQWAVAPPDGFYRNGEWIYLTNIHKTYWPTQKAAWDVAVKNAKRTRTPVKLYSKSWRIIREHNYSPKGGKSEKVQAT